MAALVASQRRAMVHSITSMKALLCRARLMSSYDSKSGTDHVYHEKGDQEGKKVWPDREVLFNPYDQMKFPLPGNVSPAPVFVTATPTPNSLLLQPKPAVDIDVLTNKTRYQDQADVLAQFDFEKISQLEKNIESDGNSSLDIEMKVQDCPLLIRKDFQQLFPGSDIMAGHFTVVSLCQRTENDMTGWSEHVESERDALLELYSETAKELCSVLDNAGYWADYIDPCSGKPMFGPYTTDVMFETDDRYRHFGFDIEDLGCCKVIKHHKWGTKSFVGCIFTNAPVDAPVLVELGHFTRDV